MKKILFIITVFIISFSLIGCQPKYRVDRSNMPDQLRIQHLDQMAQFQAQLDELEENDYSRKDLLFNIGLKYELLGEFSEAIDYYEQVLKLDPLDYASLKNIATMYEELQEIDLALEYVDRLYDNYPTDLQVVKDSVRILIAAERVDDAQELLESTLVQAKGEFDTVAASNLFEQIQKAKGK